MSPAPDYFNSLQAAPIRPWHLTSCIVESSEPTSDNVSYYNARLDPANYLEGPLSSNPATRLRQMLARPGIIVCLKSVTHRSIFTLMSTFRLLLAFAME
ncbi:hypothetical protein C0991_010813 [Blastosporella zonata]|nr:hypothetical protein C0991_010813 [Blastosporella zonata]